MNDLISRQAAIDAMTSILWHYPNECYRKLNEYEFAKRLAELGLKSVPSAQQWIPCSERLPNHDECIKNNGLFNVSDGDRSYSEWYDNDKRRFGEPTMSGFRVDYAVIAWMPLLEPCEVEK